MSTANTRHQVVAPEKLNNFDVVRLRYEGRNIMAVVMKRLHIPDSDTVQALMIYPVFPEHNPSEATRLAAKSAKDKYYYVSSKPYKEKMGLDPEKDYRIGLKISGFSISPESPVIRLGSLANTKATDVLLERYSSQTKALQKKQQPKEVLDASTRKMLQGPSTFGYDKITSSDAASFASAPALDKRLEPLKLKKKKEVSVAEPKPITSDSLYGMWAQHAGIDIALLEPAAKSSTLTTPVETIEPAVVSISKAEVETAPEPIPVVPEKDPEPDVSLNILYEKGMISKYAQKAFARNSENGLEEVSTMMQAFRFLQTTPAAQIPGISKTTAERTEYEIYSAVEELLGFEI